MIGTALAAGKRVLVAVRDVPVSEDDPFSTEERIEMIRAAFLDKPVKVIPIDDVESVNYGRGVGYEIIEHAGTEHASASSIRRRIREGDDSWRDDVPSAVASYIRRIRTLPVVWLTGLPCSGKTTIGRALVERLGSRSCLLDGDVVRGGLNADLSFSSRDRTENIRRVAHIARMFSTNGTLPIAAFVSPSKHMRNMAKSIVGPNRWLLVHVHCPVEICRERDVKGMWARARAGAIQGFTGVDGVYDAPDVDESPLRLDTANLTVDRCVTRILRALQDRACVGPRRTRD